MVNELISDWLDSQLIVPYNGPLPEKWKRFLVQEGYTIKSLPEAQFQYFGDEGYTAKTLQERYVAWLNAVIY